MPSQLLKLYGGEFSPAQYAPALWLDAADQSTLYQERTGASATTLVASDADPVGTWRDKSGNARHVTAPSDAARPTWKTAVQNGRSVVRFDGSDDRLTRLTTDVTLQGLVRTVFIVSKPTASGSDKCSFDSSNNFALTQDGTTGKWYQNSVKTFTSPGTNTTWIFSALDPASGSSTVRVNGSPTTLSPVTSNVARNGTLSVGAANPTVPTLYFPGDIHEIVVYMSALSTSQIQQVERYLAAKWGITL